MAYTMTRYEHQLISAGDGTSTATAGRKPCHTHPFTVRRASLGVVVAGTTTAPVVTLRKRVTPATDTGSVVIGTLTMNSATAVAGTVVFLDGLDTLISFGEEVYANVSTAGGGSLTVDVNVEIEQTPDNPDNSGGVLVQVTA